MHRPRPTVIPALALVALAAARAAAPTWAQYKIVGPDGSVTYTDRPPPPATPGNVVDMGRRGPDAAPSPAAPALPAELQRISARYPVVIYVGENCAPCDSGRALLRQRGVPYSERMVVSADDADALVQRTGARSLPALSVGAQVVRGYSEVDWVAYLDAAGYPRESRLPAGWAPPPATPLAARSPPPVAPPPRATAAAPPPSLPPPPAPGTIRF
jgi:glutaredoxin